MRRRRMSVKRLLLFGGIVFLISLFLGGPYGFVRIAQLSWKKHLLDKRMEQVKLDIDLLNAKCERLKHDNELMKQIAKERLGMVEKE